MSAITPRLRTVDEALGAVYRLDLDPSAWLAGMTKLDIVDHVANMGAVFQWGEDGRWGLAAMTIGNDGDPVMQATRVHWGQANKIDIVDPGFLCGAQSEAMGVYPLPPPWDAIYAAGGATDAWGLFARAADDTLVCVSYTLARRGRTPPPAKRFWKSVTFHIAAAARLRRALDASPEAIFTPGGTLLHAAGIARDPEHREALRHAARAIDRARLKKAEPIAAIESWTAMVSGRWTLVDQFESDSKRFVVARVNEPKLEERASLSPRERHVAALVALGRSNKEIAYELGMSAPTVASHLHRICKKLGVTRAGLIGK